MHQFNRLQQVHTMSDPRCEMCIKVGGAYCDICAGAVMDHHDKTAHIVEGYAKELAYTDEQAKSWIRRRFLKSGKQILYERQKARRSGP